MPYAIFGKDTYSMATYLSWRWFVNYGKWVKVNKWERSSKAYNDTSSTQETLCHVHSVWG